MIINIFDIANHPLQELLDWFINVRNLYIASAIIACMISLGMYKAFRSVGMSRRNSKKWSSRITTTVDVLDNLNSNKK